MHLLSCLIVKLLKRRILHGQLRRVEFAACFPLNRWVANLKHPKALAQHSFSSAPMCFTSFDLSLALLSSINLSQWQTVKTDDCNPHEEERTLTRFQAQCSNRATLRRHDLTAVEGGIVLHLHARLISLFVSSQQEGITVGGMLGTTEENCAKCKLGVAFKMIASKITVYFRRISTRLSWRFRENEGRRSHLKTHSQPSHTKINQ